VPFRFTGQASKLGKRFDFRLQFLASFGGGKPRNQLFFVLGAFLLGGIFQCVIVYRAPSR